MLEYLYNNNNRREKMEDETKKKSKAWIWIIAAVIVVFAGLSIWYFTKGNSTSTSDDTKTAVTIPDGWLGFTSNKYHFSLSYSSDYKVEENAVGTLKFIKDGKEMIDMYVLATNGDEAGIMSAQEALFTNDEKGYMVMDSVIQGKVAGFTSKTITGVFGKNAGVNQTHDGVPGSASIFAPMICYLSLTHMTMAMLVPKRTSPTFLTLSVSRYI